jgi:hypothetical protein
MRGRLLLVLSAVLLVAATLWLLRDRDAPAAFATEHEASPEDGAASARGRLGNLAALERDPGSPVAEVGVRARIVDLEGMPVEEGTVILECLEEDDHLAPIAGGVVRVGEEGRVAGPGCRGTVCAELRHASMVRAEPWVLEPGTEIVVRARMLDRLEGDVVDPDGAPVAGASLVLVPVPGEEDPAALPPFVSRMTTTDAEGAFAFFRIERPPCNPCREDAGRCADDPDDGLVTYDEMLLTARAPGYRLTEVVVRADQAEEDEPVRIELLRPASAIVGELLDGAGNPYARASVLARSTTRPHEIHSADATRGAFDFRELGDGTYRLRAIQDGVELAVVERASAGERVAMRGRLSATGTDLEVEIIEEGRPVAGLTVDGGPFSGAETDAQGVVVARQVVPHRYVLRVRGPGRDASSHPVSVGGSAATQRFRIDLSASGAP